MKRLRLALALSTLALFVAASPPVRAGGARVHTVAPTRPAPESRAAMGLVYVGLAAAAPGSLCGALGFEIRSRSYVSCSHGPDAAPPGIDVRRPVSVAELRTRAAATPPSARTVPCIGNGTTGDRVQAIYGHITGTKDRFTSVAPLIRTFAAQANDVYDASAAETGGSRQLRFVTKSCVLSVLDVTLPKSAGGDFNAEISALRAKGFKSTNRKYLIWTDANFYCGLGSLFPDSSPSPSNPNNTGPGYASVEPSCWGLQASENTSVEGHEVTHTMGSVQSNSPHHSVAGHCEDEWDVMCYLDAPGTKLRFPCPSPHAALLDCNHDDYFSTAPKAGSYLATNWNSANNQFLIRDVPPANDDFLNAEPLVAGAGTYVGSNVQATSQAGEPAAASQPAKRSVWYQIEATGNGLLTVDTQGSGFDTVLGIYTGLKVQALKLQADDDDATPRVHYSRAQIQAVKGKTYRVKVDGKAGATGPIQLHVSFGAPPPTITGITPKSGPPGTRVTVTGTHLLSFQPFTLELDGFFPIKFLQFTDTKIVLVVPSKTLDPSTVNIPAGSAGPVSIQTARTIGVSDATFKVT